MTNKKPTSDFDAPPLADSTRVLNRRHPIETCLIGMSRSKDSKGGVKVGGCNPQIVVLI